MRLCYFNKLVLSRVFYTAHQTLNVKRAEQPSAPPAQNTQASAALSAMLGIGSGSAQPAPQQQAAAEGLAVPQQQPQQQAAPLPVPPPPPAVIVEPLWQYLDPQGQVQGPFAHANMRQWHEAGYFVSELPIRLQQWSKFHPFHTVYPNLEVAFLAVPPHEPGSHLPSRPQLLGYS